MKTKPTKKAVEAVLDELYPHVAKVARRFYPGGRIKRDWRNFAPEQRGYWNAIARWHLSKLNARKP